MSIHHEPYISANRNVAEFSPRAIFLGILFGILFGASTSYLALKVGLTVTASIPIAVLSISIFKKWGNSTILENNIVQTIGSAGDSIAAGVAFTLPALIFLSSGAEFFTYFHTFLLALIGGFLGVLFMVPLRRTLIVREHGRLPYPEGVACADILVAGEKGGTFAHQIYYGIGIAIVYKFFMSILGFWKEVPQYLFSKTSPLPNGSITAEVTPELLGVGYIIGLRLSAILVAGGVLSSLMITPMITYFGDMVTTVIAPGTKLISEMSPMQVWNYYVRYIGAGAVTFGGLVTMIKTIPTIVQTVRDALHIFKPAGNKGKQATERTDRDLPLFFVIGGALILIVAMVLLPSLPVNWLSAFIILIAGFFFVTVSSRIVGLIGTSSNPVSGMTIATLIGTSLIFIVRGMTDDIYQPIALSVGAIVAIAAANAGAICQDLKTGFLVGATPIKQQIGMMIGVVFASATIGLTIVMLANYVGLGEVTAEHPHALPAPQAMLMATIIKGLFNQSLPWSLILMGMALAAVVELCGVSSLAFAVGAYLPLSTTSPIFIGGLIKWCVRRKKTIKAEDADLESGALFSSGLIAGGALTGILIAVLYGTMIAGPSGKLPLMHYINTGWGEQMGARGDLIAITCFLVLCALLFGFALKRVNNKSAEA